MIHFTEEESYGRPLQRAFGPMVSSSTAPPPQPLLGLDGGRTEGGVGVEGKRKGSSNPGLWEEARVSPPSPPHAQ